MTFDVGHHSWLHLSYSGLYHKGHNAISKMTNPRKKIQPSSRWDIFLLLQMVTSSRLCMWIWHIWWRSRKGNYPVHWQIILSIERLFVNGQRRRRRKREKTKYHISSLRNWVHISQAQEREDWFLSVNIEKKRELVVFILVQRVWMKTGETKKTKFSFWNN